MASRAILAVMLAATLVLAALTAGDRREYAPAVYASTFRDAPTRLDSAARPALPMWLGAASMQPELRGPGDVAMLGLFSSAPAKKTFWEALKTSNAVQIASFFLKTWKFWMIVFVLVQMLRRVLRDGIRRFFAEVPNRNHSTNTVADLAETHEYTCEKCGFTIFPARGRDNKFFPKNYVCPNPECEAPKEAFFDVNSKTDPRAVKYREEDEDFDWVEVELSSERLTEEDGAAPEAGFKR
jgi:hypothetical protein